MVRAARWEVTLDLDATLLVPLDGELSETERPTLRLAALKGHALRPQTPALAMSLPLTRDARATLTLLTGLHAGRIMAVEGPSVVIGRADDANLVVDETGVSRRHARIGRTPTGGFYVEDLASTNGTFVGAARVGISSLDRGDLLQLGPYLRVRFAIVDPVEEALYRQLYESSVRDPLTRVFNRKYLADRLFAEIARARRADGDVAVLMIDLDSLKAVNDRFGHLAGDQALCAVASSILRVLRVEDVLARYGGDEFVVLAVGPDHTDAERLAERVRRAVEGLNMSAEGHEVRLTTSIGVASLAELEVGVEPVTALLAMADSRMYGAKASGKNQVCVACTTAKASPALSR